MNTNLDNNSNTICTRCGCSTSSYTKGLCCKCSRNKTITKIILYFIFIAVYSIIITSLGMFAHIQIGGIPTVILLGITLYLPHIIVNKIFSRRKITKTKQTKTMESLTKKQTAKKTNLTKNINTQSTLSNNTKTTEIYKNKTVFCKKCGNKLDDNKKCTSCGKQYFYSMRIIRSIKQISFSKKNIIIFVIIMLLFCSVGFNIYQYINTNLSTQELNNQISNLNSAIESKDKTIDNWKTQYNSQENIIEDQNNTIEELEEKIKSYEKVDSYRGESDIVGEETDTKRTFANEIKDYRAGKISGDKYYSGSPYPSYPYNNYAYTIR